MSWSRRIQKLYRLFRRQHPFVQKRLRPSLRPSYPSALIQDLRQRWGQKLDQKLRQTAQAVAGLRKEDVRLWAQSKLQHLRTRAENKDEVLATLKNYAPYGAIAVVMLMIVDLATLSLRGSLVPQWIPPAPKRVRASAPDKSKTRDAYLAITDRNIFNSDGVIPDALGFESTFDQKNAIPTSLPIQVAATIIHGDPSLSIAVLQLKDEDAPTVYRSEESIGDLAQIVAIRRGRVYFHAKATQRLEFAEMPQESPLMLGEFKTNPVGIKRDSDSEFRIEQKVLEEHTKDITTLLQQARAVPHIGPNGQLDGFRIEMIQSGSVFEQLGIKKGDVLKGVNGQQLSSVPQAISLYNKLRSGDKSIQLDIERGGRTESLNYSIQ